MTRTWLPAHYQRSAGNRVEGSDGREDGGLAGQGAPLYPSPYHSLLIVLTPRRVGRY